MAGKNVSKKLGAVDDVVKAATHLLRRLAHTTTEEYKLGAEKVEREALEDALRNVGVTDEEMTARPSTPPYPWRTWREQQDHERRNEKDAQTLRALAAKAGLL